MEIYSESDRNRNRGTSGTSEPGVTKGDGKYRRKSRREGDKAGSRDRGGRDSSGHRQRKEWGIQVVIERTGHSRRYFSGRGEFRRVFFCFEKTPAHCIQILQTLDPAVMPLVMPINRVFQKCLISLSTERRSTSWSLSRLCGAEVAPNEIRSECEVRACR